jgi:hypothetical protein
VQIWLELLWEDLAAPQKDVSIAIDLTEVVEKIEVVGIGVVGMGVVEVVVVGLAA